MMKVSRKTTRQQWIANEHARRTERRRKDQVQCPKCECFGCPRVGSYNDLRRGLTRYRRCVGCGYRFKTFEEYLRTPDPETGREWVRLCGQERVAGV